MTIMNVLALIPRLRPGDGGDAGRADGGGWAGRRPRPGHGLQPIAAQHSDGVQHVVSPHAVQPPHPARQTQR